MIRNLLSYLIWLQFLYLFNCSILQSYFRETRIITDIDPTSIVVHPKEDIIYILEKGGKILGIGSQGPFQKPVLDLTQKVDNSGERGLLCMIFDPNYQDNNWVYIFYSLTGANRNIVSRIILEGDHADPNSEEVIIELEPTPTPFNNGGQLLAVEGKLYIFTGDGTIPDNAWKMNSLSGKVLRFNLDGTIAEDNPFYNVNIEMYRAIYAYGLRNPAKAAINSFEKKIFFSDIGETWEEINELVAKKNYGWPYIEGKISKETNPPISYKDPIYTYQHLDGYCAMSGALFYLPRGQRYPSKYENKFFFTDYCHGDIRTIDLDNFVLETFATNIIKPVGLAFDHEGNLIYATRGSNHTGAAKQSGELYRIIYFSEDSPSFSIQPMGTIIPEGKPVTFYVAVSGYQPITYQWRVNGEVILGAESEFYTLNSAKLKHNNNYYQVDISNQYGSETSQMAFLKVVTNYVFTSVITKPWFNYPFYKAHTYETFEGVVSDIRGKYNGSFFTWEILFHHDEYTHPVMLKTNNVNNGSILLSFNEPSPNVWYEFILTGKDERGISFTYNINIHPMIAAYVIETEPPGLILEIDSVKYSTPFQFDSTVGIKRKIGAYTQTYRGIVYAFVEWKDGNKDHEYILTVPDRHHVYQAYFKKEKEISNGIRYYFSEGKFEYFPEFDRFISFDKILPTFSIETEKNEDFAIKYYSYINITFQTAYTFYITSNGGCQLTIRGAVVLENNTYGNNEKETFGTIYLTLGSHYLEVICFFRDRGPLGKPILQVQYSAQNILKQDIPYSILFEKDPNPCIPQRFKLCSLDSCQFWHKFHYNFNRKIDFGILLLNNVNSIPKYINFTQQENKILINRPVSSGLSLTFSVEGPAQLQFVNPHERWLIMTGEPGNITLTYFSQGNHLYCPSHILTETFSVLNPDYIKLPKIDPARSRYIGKYGIIFSIFSFAVGIIVFAIYSKRNKINKADKYEINHEDEEIEAAMKQEAD